MRSQKAVGSSQEAARNAVASPASCLLPTAHCPLLSASCLLLTLFLVGCRSNSDLVEAELRTREREIHELRDQLSCCRSNNKAAQRELHFLHSSSPGKISPEQASQIYRLQSIALARQTGGYDSGHGSGDNSLQVVVEPRDPDGHAIKAPGSLVVQAVEVNAEGLKRPLSSWQVSEEQLRKSWRSGILSSGYFVILPWQVPPATDKLRITVQFLLADGRAFEADKDVTIRLSPLQRAIPTNGSKLPGRVIVPPPTPVMPPCQIGPGVPKCVRPAQGCPTGPPIEFMTPVPMSKAR